MLPVLLRRYGFTVSVAASVVEALTEIKTHEFDLLLCDLHIHHAGDGYTVVHAMREINPRCITIILTGYPDFQTAVEGIRQGVDDYIVKPTNGDALIALLAEKLASRGPKARILSASYDEPLARTRQMLLEREGYEIVSALEFDSSIERCKEGNFDLFILCHSIAHSEKLRMVEHFRRVCSVAIISLRRTLGEQIVEGTDYSIDPDPEELVETIAKIVRGKTARSKGLS